LVLGLTGAGVDVVGTMIVGTMIGVGIVEIVAGGGHIAVKSLDIPRTIAQKAYR